MAAGFVDEARERQIELRHALCVVRGQRDVDTVVDVEPFRVVVHFLRLDRDARTVQVGS